MEIVFGGVIRYFKFGRAPLHSWVFMGINQQHVPYGTDMVQWNIHLRLIKSQMRKHDHILPSHLGYQNTFKCIQFFQKVLLKGYLERCPFNLFHYSDVAWASWRLNSATTLLLFSLFLVVTKQH